MERSVPTEFSAGLNNSTSPGSTRVLAPLCLFGPISWYGQLINREVWFEIHEHFPKQTYRSRYTIYGNHGPLTLSALLDGRSSKTKTKDIRLSYRENWPQNHWRALTAAYSSSPFFEFYADEVEAILLQKHKTLMDLNLAAHNWVMHTLGFLNNFQLTEEYQNNWKAIDIRGEKKTEFNPPEPFPGYHQVFMDTGEPFLSNLSILDLLFNLGNEARVYLLKNFQSPTTRI